MLLMVSPVATVLTVYGIETRRKIRTHLHDLLLQQYLPFTVLKLTLYLENNADSHHKLQQYLPFTVLKRILHKKKIYSVHVATVLTVYGIETLSKPGRLRSGGAGCNSTYRLRY